MSINLFKNKKKSGEKITMLTCYDYWSAQILNQTAVDALLVGDSLTMVMHGHTSTVPADTQLIKIHTESVVRGAPDKFIVADMPFMSVRKGLAESLSNIETLMKTGAHAVKIEGVEGHEDVIKQSVGSGAPVMGHLGLTPQSVNQFGGYKVQGRTEKAQALLKEQAITLEDLGCFAVVFECVPKELAAEISQSLSIPVIGIGAGPNVDGQILVLHDALGLNQGKPPKFVREYVSGRSIIGESVDTYVSDVQSGKFPSEKECY